MASGAFAGAVFGFTVAVYSNAVRLPYRLAVEHWPLALHGSWLSA